MKKSGNNEIYSFNKNFSDQSLWKFTIYSQDEDNMIFGMVEKVKKNENLQFSVEEAKNELKKNFSKEEISLFNYKSSNGLFQGKNVAFTLRVSLEERRQLEPHENKTFTEEENPDVREIKTESIKEENEVANIHGLLITKEIPSLQKCAQILASKFPCNNATWMTFCTNTISYRKHFNIVKKSGRIWLKKNGNIEIYSLNKSFSEQIL